MRPWLGSLLYGVEISRRASPSSGAQKNSRPQIRPRTTCSRESSFIWGELTKPSGRPGRQWSLTLFLMQHKTTSLAFSGMKENWMRRTRIARKAAELHPAAASSHRWQVLVAIQRGDGEAALREAQLEPDESLPPLRTCACALCARRSIGRRRGFGRPDRPRSRSATIKLRRFTPCAVRKRKRSSGYKSRLIITTPACSPF